MIPEKAKIHWQTKKYCPLEIGTLAKGNKGFCNSGKSNKIGAKVPQINK